GLDVHRAIQNMMKEMFDVFLNWTIENGYEYVAFETGMVQGHIQQYRSMISELVSDNPYYNKSEQHATYANFRLMGWTRPTPPGGPATGAISKSHSVFDIKHNTGAPPARSLKEQLKTLEQYQSDMYGDGKHQWVA